MMIIIMMMAKIMMTTMMMGIMTNTKTTTIIVTMTMLILMMIISMLMMLQFKLRVDSQENSIVLHFEVRREWLSFRASFVVFENWCRTFICADFAFSRLLI